MLLNFTKALCIFEVGLEYRPVCPSSWESRNGVAKLSDRELKLLRPFVL
jgi:hypothetical protein